MKKRWSSIALQAQQKEKSEAEETLSNLENAEPELCIKLLHFPSVQNFSGLKRKIQQCSEEWMLGFLDQDGLGVLFTTLERLSNEKARSSKNSIIASMELLHCVGCVKSVMNSRTGLEYVISKNEYTRMLSSALGSSNIMVKKQVFELLAAMCIYSPEGKIRAIDAMEHYKQAKSQRYRFSVAVNELRTNENAPYQTAILSFVNAAVLSTDTLHDRMQLRNEFIGLQILDIISQLRHSESEDLLIQLEVFEERKLEDEDELESLTNASGIDLNNHQDVFSAVFNKICAGPQSNHLLAILQSFLQLNTEDPVTDVIWEVAEVLVQKAVVIKTKDEGKKLVKGREIGPRAVQLKKVVNVHVQTDVDPKKDSTPPSSGYIPPPPPTAKIPSPPPMPGSIPPPPLSAGIPPPPLIGAIPPPPSGIPPPPSMAGGIPPPPPIGAIPPPPSGIPPPPSMAGGIPPPPPIGAIPPPPSGIPPPSSMAGGIPPPPPIGAIPHPPSGIPPPPSMEGGIPPPPPMGRIPPPPGGIPPPPGGIPPPPGSIPPPPGGVPPPPGGIPPPPGGIPPPPGGIPLPPGGIVPMVASYSYSAPPPMRSLSVPKPKSKLRKFNWQKIPSNALKNRSNSLWECLEREACEVEPNYQEIEELFAQKVISKAPAKATKKAAPTEVSLVDSRRSLNINIFLRQFRLSHDAIIAALMEGNREILTEEKLQGMLKFLPEQSDIEMIRSFPGDPATLGNVEKYFLALSKVTGYQLRIEALITRETFEEAMNDIGPALLDVMTACKEIRTCKKLEDFLMLILKTGNYMNFGGHSGGAQGFKITSLLKLSETKANKPRMTLLHYVVMEAEKKQPDLLTLPNDLATVEKCCTVSVEQLQKDVKRLAGVIGKLQRQVGKASDEIKKQFESFLSEAASRVEVLDGQLNEIEVLRVDLANYLVEDVKKFKLEEGISTFAKFSNQIKNAVKENKERAVVEEKKRKREAQEAERIKSGAPRSKRNAPPPAEENIIDNLLKDIRKGFRLKKSPAMDETSPESGRKATKHEAPLKPDIPTVKSNPSKVDTTPNPTNNSAEKEGKETEKVDTSPLTEPNNPVQNQQTSNDKCEEPTVVESPSVIMTPSHEPELGDDAAKKIKGEMTEVVKKDTVDSINKKDESSLDYDQTVDETRSNSHRTDVEVKDNNIEGNNEPAVKTDNVVPPVSSESSDTETGSSTSDNLTAEEILKIDQPKVLKPASGEEEKPSLVNADVDRSVEEPLSTNNVGLIVGEMLDLDEPVKSNGINKITTVELQEITADKAKEETTELPKSENVTDTTGKDVSSRLDKVIAAFKPSRQETPKSNPVNRQSGNGTSVDSTSKDTSSASTAVNNEDNEEHPDIAGKHSLDEGDAIVEATPVKQKTRRSRIPVSPTKIKQNKQKLPVQGNSKPTTKITEEQPQSSRRSSSKWKSLSLRRKKGSSSSANPPPVASGSSKRPTRKKQTQPSSKRRNEAVSTSERHSDKQHGEFSRNSSLRRSITSLFKFKQRAETTAGSSSTAKSVPSAAGVSKNKSKNTKSKSVKIFKP